MNNPRVFRSVSRLESLILIKPKKFYTTLIGEILPVTRTVYIKDKCVFTHLTAGYVCSFISEVNCGKRDNFNLISICGAILRVNNSCLFSSYKSKYNFLLFYKGNYFLCE